MKKIYAALAVLAVAGFSVRAQEFDDIYYNPKKDKEQVSQKNATKKSNYIKDFSSIDVDEYNRRGQYYETPVDTIGSAAESGEDFVYTQKIQKYYNPTIVVDNAAVLMDVLDNSYGNVEIVFDNGLPYFNSIYGWPGFYSYYNWLPSWRWNSSYYWAWSPVWGWDYYPTWSIGPSWSWGWGPSFGMSWGWGWDPWYPSYGWGYGPAWGGVPYHNYANYRPNGRRPNYPGENWALNTRPGGNAGGPASSRPGYSGVHASNNGANNTAVNYHRGSSYNTGSVSNRVNGTSTTPYRGSYTVGSDGHRRYGSTTSGSQSYNGSSSTHRSSSQQTVTTNRNSNSSTYNSNRSSSSGRSSSYSSGSSRSSSGSMGGSYGGGRSSSGSGRGRR